MSEKTPATSNQMLLDEASDWIAKLDRGLEDRELPLLDEFLDKPGARELFLELAKVSDQLNSLSTLAADTPEPQRSRGRQMQQFAVAAMLVLAVSVSLLFISTSEESTRPALDVIVYETLTGEQSVVRLEDGSDVALNTGTQLKIIFADSGRLAILLKGEAFFDVASDPYRPFSVVAGDHLIQAVGTSFSVYKPTRGPVEVIVQEGKVRVKADDALSTTGADEVLSPPTLIVGGYALEAGQLGLFSQSEEQVSQIDGDRIEAELSWRQGKLVFRGETLERALADVSRYTTTEFEFLDEDAKSIAVAGVFQSGDVDGLLQTLAANLGITYQRIDDGHILISRR